MPSMFLCSVINRRVALITVWFLSNERLHSGLFVEPKWAKYLSNSGVGAALGKKPSGLDTCGDGNDEVGRRPK